MTIEKIAPGRFQTVLQFHSFVLALLFAILSHPASAQYVVDGYTHSDVGDYEYDFDQSSTSTAPHRILQSPHHMQGSATNPLRAGQNSPSLAGMDGSAASPGHSHHANAKANAARMVDETLHAEGPLLRRLHEHKQPSSAVIPDAVVQPRWKAPYAYGYFGASGTKSWTKTFGYRDTYTRWTKQ